MTLLGNHAFRCVFRVAEGREEENPEDLKCCASAARFQFSFMILDVIVAAGIMVPCQLLSQRVCIHSLSIVDLRFSRSTQIDESLHGIIEFTSVFSFTCLAFTSAVHVVSQHGDCQGEDLEGWERWTVERWSGKRRSTVGGRDQSQQR